MGRILCSDTPWWRHQNETFVRVTGPLWGETTGDRWIPSQRPMTQSSCPIDHKPRSLHFTLTVTKFCELPEGQALPHDAKFHVCDRKIADGRVIFGRSLIHGLRWFGLINAEPEMRLILAGMMPQACVISTYRVSLYWLKAQQGQRQNIMGQSDLELTKVHPCLILTCCSCCDSLRWRHNERDGVSNHQRLDGLLNRLFRRRSKKTSKLRVTGLCEGNSPHNRPVKRKMFPFGDVIMDWFWEQGVREISRVHRYHPGYGLGQWETRLQSNAVSHQLSTYRE